MSRLATLLRIGAVLATCTALLPSGLLADEGALDVAGFHAPNGFFAGTPSPSPDPLFSVARAAMSGDWAFFAYSTTDHHLAWRSVSPGGATSPCVFAISGHSFYPVDALLDRENRLLIAGTGYASGAGRFLFVVRYLVSGCTLDSSFINNGFFYYDLPSDLSASRLALQTFGFPPFTTQKIVLGGTVVYGAQPDFSDMVFLRLDDSGEYDESFGFGGAQILDYDDDDNNLADYLVDRENRIVAVGAAGSGTPGRDALLVRLLVDGAPDLAFGYSGFRRFHQSSTDRADDPNGIVRAPGDDLYLAGTSSDATENRIVVTRLSGEHGFTLDDAEWPTDVGRYVSGVAVQGDRRLIVAGQASSALDTNLFTLAFQIPQLVLDPDYNDLSDADPLSFVDLPLHALPHELGSRLAMSNEQPILTGYVADEAQMATEAAPFVLRLTNRFLFADGFEDGHRSAWD